MRYFWILDQEAQTIFKFLRHPGKVNLGDYQTKTHDGKHHQKMRPIYLHENKSPQFLQWVNTLGTSRGCEENIPQNHVSSTAVHSRQIHSTYPTLVPYVILNQ